MIRPRRDWASWWVNRLGLNRLHGPSRDGVIDQRPARVCHPHRPIHPFLHLHMGRPDVGLYLIEVPVVRHRPVAAQDARGFEAETPVQVAARGTGPMEIGRLRRRDGKAPVVDR